jgi:DNA-binding beta-propeller fold protein YncE
MTTLLRLAALSVAIFGAASTRAELFVLYPGSPGNGAGAVGRFDDVSGAKLRLFGQENEGMRALAVDPAGDVLVSAEMLGAGLIYRFNAQGDYLGKVADVVGADFTALAVAPDGALHAIAWLADANDASIRHVHIVRFPGNGAPAVILVSEGSGDMTSPRALAFGPDGQLYVADARAGVLRFDAASGAALDAFVPVDRGGLVDASALAFGPDGKLYVASAQANAVLRFDAASGAFIDTFVVPQNGGLTAPRALTFGLDRNLYVTSAGFNQVLRFDGRTGLLLSGISGEAGFRPPAALAFVAARERAPIRHAIER